MVQLSEYQVASRDFLLNDGKFKLLADEPGVGKTFPAIDAAWNLKTMIKDNYDRQLPVLITAPAYLLHNWRYEIKRLYRGAKVEIANGTGYLERRKSFDSEADFVLTSYNNWSAKSQGAYQYWQLADQEWSVYIFDEGHRLRGRNSAWTKHVFRTRLSRSANSETPIWVLTGTPFVRDGGDFYPFFHLYDKKRYGSYWRFVDDRCVTQDTPYGKKVGNIRRSYREEFSQELAEFTLRRTVGEIPELQGLESITHDYYVDMPPSVIKMIQKAKKEYVLEHPDLSSPGLVSGPGALYQVQRRVATNPPTKVKPKLYWLQDFLVDRVGKVVVFVWYKDSAHLITEALGSNAVLVTGDVPTTRRSGVVDKWRTGKAQVLVATISSLKEGISLTESNHVVFLESSELPADMEQATKRLLRRGQKKLVNVHYVWAKGTVDKAIKRVLDNRSLGLQEALTQWVKEEPEGEDRNDGWF